MEEKNNPANPGGDTASEVPSDVCSLCDDLMVRVDGEKGEKKHSIYKNIFCGGEDFFLRAVPIHKISREKEIPHIMITVERFSTRLRADLKKVGSKYGLTKREVEVLKGVARGMTNKEISGILFISEHTVKDHVRSIMQKISVKNRSQLICRIFESNQ
jgi:DNA-binding CsgD family transcriptional regulator